MDNLLIWFHLIELIHIPNFNNSFAEYGQFVDLVSLDRANPQFDKIMKKKEDK